MKRERSYRYYNSSRKEGWRRHVSPLNGIIITVALWMAANSSELSPYLPKEVLTVRDMINPIVSQTYDSIMNTTDDMASPRETTVVSENTPDGFVELRNTIPGIIYDIRYATTQNLTGKPLAGYVEGKAWLLEDAADKLRLVQNELKEEGYGLKIYDGYRPKRATDALVFWAINTGRSDLLDGYIAKVSKHNRGAAVDLSIVDMSTGKELDMGTDYDDLTPASNTANASGMVMENRQLLKRVMEKNGFSNNPKEWWHYDYVPQEDAPVQDIPYETTINKISDTKPETNSARKRVEKDGICWQTPAEDSAFELGWGPAFYNKSYYHQGIDYAALQNASGIQVYSPVCEDGVVTFAGEDTTSLHGGFGNHVRLSYPDKLGDKELVLSHFKQLSVKKGEEINGDVVIGIMGDTGNTIDVDPADPKFGARHVHIELRDEKGGPMDPRSIIPDSIFNK